ncbi:hypothetical protein TWF694_005343 [Orbilia ellipsospora]|uniref:Uncharacterized protein n=1 Tax=Orbilia ellipsospora TaxID=2528407 RepID=A0AAV9WU54_9PEZI
MLRHQVYAGGINVISGKPENETTAKTLRRRNLLTKGESVQDYVVIPGQRRINGIAVGRGKARQSIATPLGDGFTVEGQMTGSEDVGELQFEIIGTRNRQLGFKMILICIRVQSSANGLRGSFSEKDWIVPLS